MDSEKSKQCITKNSHLKRAFGKAKLFGIRRLVRSIKRLSAKKGTTQQLDKNERRVSRMEKELAALKGFHVDMFIKAASVKIHSDDLNPSDFMSEDDEDVAMATKMKVMDKIISAVGLDNIRDLSHMKEEKNTAVKSSRKKKTKTSVSSKNCSKSLPKDDKGLDIVSTGSKEEEELDDMATKMKAMDKMISANGLDNIQDLSHMKKEKNTAVKSSRKKKPKTSVSSKTCSKSLLKDDHDKELHVEIRNSKEDKELDDFFTDPVVNDYNAMDTSKGRALKKRKLEAADDDVDKAFDSVFVQKLKGEKGKKKGKNNQKDFREKRKNRVGQRERRKQWEKLYGNKANHLKNEKKVQEKSSKGDVKKSKRNDTRKQKPVTVNSSSLHPSWEASKSKRKQESIVEFKGQKITFED